MGFCMSQRNIGRLRYIDPLRQLELNMNDSYKNVSKEYCQNP